MAGGGARRTAVEKWFPVGYHPRMKTPTGERLPRPFIKWVGGKRQLLPALLPILDRLGVQDVMAGRGRFFEPFLGGGAVFFALSAAAGGVLGGARAGQGRAVLNDYNPELVNLYEVVRTAWPRLLERLGDTAVFANTRQAHGVVRGWDREEDWGRRDAVSRAARFIYLNRTSFNGLWRVNRGGHFNVPFGDYKNPGMPDAAVLEAASDALGVAVLRHGDFEAAVADAKAGDVVYFDPPYIPLTASSAFVGYAAGGFGMDEQERLAQCCERLCRDGVAWALSNSDTPDSRRLFGRHPGVEIVGVSANRAINANGEGRGKVGEIIAVFVPKQRA